MYGWISVASDVVLHWMELKVDRLAVSRVFLHESLLRAALVAVKHLAVFSSRRLLRSVNGSWLHLTASVLVLIVALFLAHSSHLEIGRFVSIPLIVIVLGVGIMMSATVYLFLTN